MPMLVIVDEPAVSSVELHLLFTYIENHASTTRFTFDQRQTVIVVGSDFLAPILWEPLKTNRQNTRWTPNYYCKEELEPSNGRVMP